MLEGPDGAGISTQTALLQAGLASRGYRAVATKEPSTGPIGSVVRQALSHRLVYPPSEPLTDEVWPSLCRRPPRPHPRRHPGPASRRVSTSCATATALRSYAYQGLTGGQEWVHELNSRSNRPRPDPVSSDVTPK